MRKYAILATVALTPLYVSAAQQQLDYPAELVTGLGLPAGTTGRLIVADTAIFFTQRNGQPIAVLPFSAVADAYTSPDPSGRRGRTAADLYLVVVLSGRIRTEILVFTSKPPAPDELSAGILAGLDARRTTLYSATPPTRRVPTTPQAPQAPVRSAIGPASEAPPVPPQPSPAARNSFQPTVPPAGAPVSPSGAPLELEEGAPGYKDGGTGTLLSLLITGGGQFYAGESGSGAALLLGSLGALVIGAAASDPNEDNYTPLYVGAGTAVFLSLYSIFDAAPAARRHNRRLAAKRSGLTLVPMVLPQAEAGVRLGMALSGGW